VCAAAKITKINKTPYFVISKFSKIIDVDTTEKLVVIGSMAMPICSRFHERLANDGKITTFTEVPLFDALVRMFP